MSHCAKACVDIPFHDIDILGIAWHGHYYKYFELARTALYRSYNFDIDAMKTMGYILPVIESHCKYVKPLKYGQHVQVWAELSECSSYIQVNYTITDQQSGQRHAYGYTKQAVCDVNGTMLLAVPDHILEVIAHETR